MKNCVTQTADRCGFVCGTHFEKLIPFYFAGAFFGGHVLFWLIFVFDFFGFSLNLSFRFLLLQPASFLSTRRKNMQFIWLKQVRLPGRSRPKFGQSRRAARRWLAGRRIPISASESDSVPKFGGKPQGRRGDEVVSLRACCMFYVSSAPSQKFFAMVS